MEEEQQKPETVPVVYQYGLLEPDISGYVKKQMRLAHEYQNKLIEIELARRDAYRNLRSELVPEVQQLEQKTEEQLLELEEAKAAQDKEAVRLARADLAATRALLREARARAKENKDLARRQKVLDAEALVKSKSARAACGVYWGTYLLVENAVQAAKKHPQPRFRRWQGEGRVGVQIQGGIPVAKALEGSDTRIRIEPVASDAYTHPSRGARKRLQRTRLWLRVGSVGREPLWAVFPMVLHRPLPSTGVIKEAHVALRLRGLQEKWVVNILLQCPPEPVQALNQHGAVALDLGWRKREAGIRAAYWVDDAGEDGELVMPASIRGRIQHAASLRSLQDQLFNKMRDELTPWINTQPHLTEHLSRAKDSLHQWRSQKRLAKLIVDWGKERMPGDEEMFHKADRWRQQALHLYSWERSEYIRALGHRREIYRIEAARIADKYGTIILEKFNLHAAKRVKGREKDDVLKPPQRSQMHDASPGEFRVALQNAARRRGVQIIEVSGAGTTHRCHLCGGDTKFDAGENLVHVCEHCGELWDQDLNAAKNLLASGVAEAAQQLTS